MIQELSLVIASLLYGAEYLLLLVGQRRSYRIPRRPHEVPPEVAVIVAARNEEANIVACLTGLLEQDYPAGCYHIIAVDDESTDSTQQLIRELADQHPGRIRLIVTTPEGSHARGKARAIAQAIDTSSAELILLTDADCHPPKVWVRSVVEHFLPDVDIVAGFTLIRATNFFSSTQLLDWIHLQSTGSCGLALGYPIGVIGNNLAFRRSAYEAVGGYRGVPFTVTEDFALFRAMCAQGSRAVFPCERDTRMFTNPCRSLREVVRQKQRWARGATANVFPGGLVLIFAVLMLVAVCVAPFVSVGAWIAVWSTKFICDILLIGPNLRRLGAARQLKYFLHFEFYFVAQALIVPFLLMNRTVVWKGRSFES